jgi:vancomycin resistance protein VanW
MSQEPTHQAHNQVATSFPKPKTRGVWRMKAGWLYYSAKRYAQWFKPGHHYASTRFPQADVQSSFPHVAFAHSSLLLRQLKDVDMWLQHNKIHNLTLALQRINGLVIHPGETMSFWRLVGNPSRRKGYKQGMVLVNGVFRPGFGGGLCQLTNLIYWMTLHTPLTVTERYRHQYDVFPDSNRSLPFGSGATIAFNYIDLQITNHTDSPYCLHLYFNESDLCGEWRLQQPQPTRYEVYEMNHHFTQHSTGHYIRHNQIWRRVLNGAGETFAPDEQVTDNHALMMYSPLLPSTESTEC